MELFTARQIGIFSTRFKAFETEFTAKTSLRTFLTIYMALSQRITQVVKDPYLLDLSELHQIGVHAYPSPRRSPFFLSPSRTDGPNDRKFRKKAHFLSLDFKPKLTASDFSSHCRFCSQMGKMNTIHLSSYYHYTFI